MNVIHNTVCVSCSVLYTSVLEIQLGNVSMIDVLTVWQSSH